jgi:predicted TIM-barrel fold metal-dependent hydrolase
MYYHTEKKLAVDLMHTWNDNMYQIMKDYPGKFDATAWLALQDLDASLAELKKVIDRGFYAVQIHAHVPWPFVPQLWKIFEICEKNNLPIYFHNNKHTHFPLPWQTNKNENYNHLKSIWPYPTSVWCINVAGMITEGLLEKYPNLKIIMAEFDIDWIKSMREEMIKSKFLDPLSYFQKNFFFTVEPENPDFLTSASLIGWDRLLFATDYPHNDPGGRHRFDDVDLLNCFLKEDKITQTQYNLLTHQNYLSLVR